MVGILTRWKKLTMEAWRSRATVSGVGYPVPVDSPSAWQTRGSKPGQLDGGTGVEDRCAQAARRTLGLTDTYEVRLGGEVLTQG
jgi:hypothetical protein